MSSNNTRTYSSTLALTVVVMLAIGIIAVYSTTYTKENNAMLSKQIIWVSAGLVMSLIVACIPINLLSKLSKWILVCIAAILTYLAIVNIANILAVKCFNFELARYMPLTQVRKGACRWLVLGPISIQPAEFAKFGLILFLSCYYGMRDTSLIESWKHGLIIPGCIALSIIVLIVAGRSLSNSAISCLLTFIVMYFAGVKLRMMMTSVAILIVAGMLVIAATPFRRQRIVNFIKHNDSATTVIIGDSQKKADNYQLERSECAIGSGGIAGLGLGRGRLKHRSIPESHTDFVFAVIGEELGFCGIAFCVLLYMLFAWMSFLISQQCRDRRCALMCMAVGAFLPLQAFMNMGVVCGLLPTTGVTAPLVSYGGSSITSIMLCVGLVFNAAKQSLLEEQTTGSNPEKECVVVPPQL